MSVVVSSEVTTIGNYAFYGSFQLKSALFVGDAPTLGMGVFDSWNNAPLEGFSVFFDAGSSGFTSPTWMGYPAVQGAPSVSIATESLPEGTSGIAYHAGIEASGGKPPFAWLIVSGSLPAGLSLSTDGIISGTATTATETTFRVRVTTANSGANDERNLSLSIGQARNAQFQGIVRNDGAPAGDVSVYAYNFDTDDEFETTTDSSGHFTLPVFGGEWSLFVWSPDLEENVIAPSSLIRTIADGESVVGLTFDYLAPTGMISGTVTNPYGTPASDNYVVAHGNINGANYSVGAWTDEDGRYQLPTVNGDWNVMAFFGQFYLSVEKEITVNGSAVVDFSATDWILPLSIITESLPDGSVGAPYETNLEGLGGTSPYIWSLESGSLPTGLTLDTDGRIHGSPTESGESTVALRVTDSEGSWTETEFSINVTSPYATWRSGHFTSAEIATGAANHLHDFDGDGMVNLLEYALGGDPKARDSRTILPTAEFDGDHLHISFTCDSSRTDLVYTIQASSTLAGNSWTDIARGPGGAQVTSIGLLAEVSDSGTGVRTVVVKDLQNLSPIGKRFLRVKVSSHGTP